MKKRIKNNKVIINHKFSEEMFFFPRWKVNVLVLGTFNPAQGEFTDYYYGRRLNRFWRCMEIITGKNRYYTQGDFSRKYAIMDEYHFGCVDIIKSAAVDYSHFSDICGKGYSDSALFSIRNAELNYQFEEIKVYLVANKIKKVINTWGKRTTPKSFREHVEDLNKFCNKHNVKFILACPSPSPRSRSTSEELCRFYRKHIFNSLNRF